MIATLLTLARLQTAQLTMDALLAMVNTFMIKLLITQQFDKEAIAGKDNVYSRDCALEGEHKCEKVDSGNSV